MPMKRGDIFKLVSSVLLPQFVEPVQHHVDSLRDPHAACAVSSDELRQHDHSPVAEHIVLPLSDRILHRINRQRNRVGGGKWLVRTMSGMGA